MASDGDPVKMSFVHFGANGHQVVIFDSSAFANFNHFDCVAAVLAVDDGWTNMNASKILQKCFIAVLIGTNVLAIGGQTDYEEIAKYLAELFGRNVTECELLRFQQWIDIDLMDYIEFEEGYKPHQKVLSVDEVPPLADAAIMQLMELFKQMNHHSSGNYLFKIDSKIRILMKLEMYYRRSPQRFTHIGA